MTRSITVFRNVNEPKDAAMKQPLDRRAFAVSFAVGAVAALSTNGAEKQSAGEWGNLTAKFLYDGEPPEPTRIKVDKDESFVKGPLFDRSLMVDSKTKGLANVVAWLYVTEKMTPVKFHPSYEQAAKEEVVVDGLNAQIEPHIATLWTRQTLILRNTDPIGHNLRSDLERNVEFQPLISAGRDQRKTYSKPETRPLPIQCTIHPWMAGWILVQDHPYMAVSDAKGVITIKNLPIGEHTFIIWHELAGFVQAVKRDGKGEKWNRGRVTVTIKPGDNDLGVILCKPDKR